MRKKIRRIKASLTLEATFIIPFITIIIVIFIYLALFVYNRCILSQSIYITSLRGSLSEDVGNVIEQEMKNEIMNEVSNKVLTGNLSVKASTIEDKSIKNETIMSVRAPFIRFAKKEGINTFWSITTIKNVEIINSAEFLRNCRKIKKLSEAKNNDA